MITLFGLTLSDQGTFTHVGAQGGSMEPPIKETSFPPEFCNEICTIYVRTIRNHNSGEKKMNVAPFQNGGQITDFYFTQNFNEIWLKVGEHE